MLVAGGYGLGSGVLKDIWLLDVDRGVWSEVSELICLVYDELHQDCMLYVCAVACIHVAMCLESLLRGLKAWVRFSLAHTACTYMWFCALHNIT